MKPKLLLCFALVLIARMLCPRAEAQDVSMQRGSRDLWRGVTNVNFSVTHPLSVHVPTKLKIERTTNMLFASFDTKTLESTNLLVGSNAVTVVLGKLFVWPVGEPRPTNSVRGFQGGLDFSFGTGFVLSTNLDGLPQAGKSYNVEMDLTAFETDAPAGHSRIFPWSTNNEIIWQRTLKQTVK